MPARKELTITKQDKFLKKYSETRAFRLSLEETPVTRETVKRWLEQDSYGFIEKVTSATNGLGFTLNLKTFQEE
tara:strand:- start:718 stop:939 length:222 start_codon:yes stop_codon:yes gene_type:complete